LHLTGYNVFLIVLNPSILLELIASRLNYHSVLHFCLQIVLFVFIFLLFFLIYIFDQVQLIVIQRYFRITHLRFLRRHLINSWSFLFVFYLALAQFKVRHVIIYIWKLFRILDWIDSIKDKLLFVKISC